MDLDTFVASVAACTDQIKRLHPHRMLACTVDDELAVIIALSQLYDILVEGDPQRDHIRALAEHWIADMADDCTDIGPLLLALFSPKEQ